MQHYLQLQLTQFVGITIGHDQCTDTLKAYLEQGLIASS